MEVFGDNISGGGLNSMKHKAVLTGLSNPASETGKSRIPDLEKFLSDRDCSVIFSDSVKMRQDSILKLTEIRVSDLNRLYRDTDTDFIFDISGGDLANTVLDGIDYEAAAASGSVFFGYSDLTSFINALFAVTGRKSVLYQVMHLVSGAGKERAEEFCSMLFGSEHSMDFVSPEGRMVVGDSMRGVLTGGNIRCLLKLAGTKFMPDFENRILLLEQFHGSPALLASQISHLSQLGAFDKISGLVLGTFTGIQEIGLDPYETVIRNFLPSDLPVFVTDEIGHGCNSRGAVIGAEYEISGSRAVCCEKWCQLRSGRSHE